MINVIIKRHKNEYELSMNGHADYSRNGNDIVCASASTIAYTLWGFLENCPEVVDIDTLEREGELEISCTADKTICRTAFYMAAIGLLQLEKAYPKNVCVKVSGF